MLFSIFTPRLAAELMDLGFPIIKTVPSNKNPKTLVYQFENTPEFQLALKHLLDARKKKS